MCTQVHICVHIHVHTYKQIYPDMSSNDHSGILGSISELNKPISHPQENDVEINNTNVLAMATEMAQRVRECLSCMHEDLSSTPVPTEKLVMVALEGTREEQIPGAH